ncbi:DUF1349 domain-containing protein [Saccharopolyspora erythraea]|uniref:DUF1349 domain-containing protein n=1 Tax=Saccharopolyspora erythraea TaxID=1836 RepID=UPI001BA828A2|nr:DUF1349 domain-containing protein [Saccharopolyspora erythraea]QUH01947.1 DUF1349 domain-containing protein [Saccharopolyspora erythraea]
MSEATSAPVGTPVGFGSDWRQVGDPEAFTSSDGAMRVTAPAGADLFSMPGSYEGSGAPMLRRTIRGDFTAWSRVSVSGEKFADAGGLSLHAADGWFKLCLERTRGGGWAVVTVLSRPHSDEAMGPALPGPDAELLLTRQGTRYAAFVRVADGLGWRFARTFTGFDDAEPELGLFAQAPFSPSCTAIFSPLSLGTKALRDSR